MRPIIISIEGNIGSGKSTLVNLLKLTFPNWNFLLEPVDTWMKIKDSDNQTILDKFYLDKKRWGYTFQNFAYITRMRLLLEAIDNISSCDNKQSVIITERSVLTDKNVFAKMLFQQGLINELEMKIYLEWFDLLQYNAKVDGIIYLKTTPEVSLERIKKRNRTSEKDISLEYLNQLHERHEDWLHNHFQVELKDQKVLYLDGDMNFESNGEILNNFLNNIKSFVDKFINVLELETV